MTVEFLYLSQEDVIECGGLDMAETIKCVEKATVMLYRQQAREADGVHLLWNGISGKRIATHAAYLGAGVEIAGGKVIASNPDNPPKRSAPRASALLTLNDPETGYPICLMEGAVISHMRTGAMTGAGARHLVKKDRPVVGLIGAGPISRVSLLALSEVLREPGDVKLFDTAEPRARALKAEIAKDPGWDTRVVKSAEDAVRGSDIVVTATNVGPGESYIPYEWLERGGVLSDVSVWDETDDLIARADRIVLNNFQRLTFRYDRFGPLLADNRLSRDKIIHLGAIITGEVTGRDRDDDVILFCPRGMCLYDIYNGNRIYESAKRKGVGRMLTLWREPVWY
jgi:ornithine cyclodeaminase/alanine dehydrogenase-like protein (mu-crystallin family)